MANAMPWAITGGPASGKSTVLQILREFGLSTASADEIAAQVLADRTVEKEVGLALGVSVPLDRSEVRERVLGDHSIRRKLNSILHPHIVRVMSSFRADVYEVPLLIETCLQHRFGRVILAWCDEKTQRARLAGRLGEGAHVDRWMQMQLPLDSKIVHSDWIVRTNMPMPNVRDDIATLVESWR